MALNPAGTWASTPKSTIVIRIDVGRDLFDKLQDKASEATDGNCDHVTVIEEAIRMTFPAPEREKIRIRAM
jgi:hypothetical protein